MSRIYRYGSLIGSDGQTPGSDMLEERDWFIDPATVRAHVGHELTVSIYGMQNLTIECVGCGSLIGDIDFIEDVE